MAMDYRIWKTQVVGFEVAGGSKSQGLIVRSSGQPS